MTTNLTDGSAIRRWWPLIAGLGLFAAMVAVVAGLGYTRTHGQLTYALDDAYIHMALAKNLARHGVLGATPFEFTSASSSPLWTLLLALVFKLTGVHDATALVLDVLIAIALIVVANLVLRRFDVPALGRFLGLFWLIFATPLAPIVFGGMEHPLQLLIDLCLVSAAVLVLSRDDRGWDQLTLAVIALAPLASSVRYEGAVLVAVIAGAFVVRRRWKVAGLILIAGAAPIVVYGLVSVALGGHFLPNSVIVKSATQTNAGLLFSNANLFVSEFKRKLSTAFPVYLLVAFSASLFVAQRIARRPFWQPYSLFASIALLTSAIHLTVGDVGWFFRYEDYMVLLLGFGLLLQLVDLLRARATWSSAVKVVLALSLALGVWAILVDAHRGDVALRSTPWAVKNIYDQQYQLAHFLKANPQYGSVAIGDLGAIAYYNDDLRILDLEGLALTGVPTSQLGRSHMTPELARRLAARNHAQIAIVFTDYFDLPSEWRPVATWEIEKDLVTYQPKVGFFAIPPTDPSALEADVRTYSQSRLPADVHAHFGVGTTSGQ